MPINELHPPVGYSWWWALAGVALFALAAGIILLVLRRTRVRRGPAPAALPSLSEVDGLRAEYNRRLDGIEDAYRKGDLDERTLHLALSAQVREFASARMGRDASVLTLTEIRQINDVRQIGPLIERYYGPSFSDYQLPGAADDDGIESIEQARTVVRTW